MFLFREGEVRIDKEQRGGGEKRSGYVVTKRKRVRHAPPHVLNMLRTGAITVSVHPDGAIRMKSFLRENLSQ